MIEMNTEEEIRAKVMHTLAEALPYKQSLSLRLLITYCVDGGAMQSCVIDEILSRNIKNSQINSTENKNPVLVRPVDLSTPKSTSPPSQIIEPFDKPIINNINTDNKKNEPLPMIWDQMKNILNNPINPNFMNKDNLLANNPFLPLLNPAKPVLDNDIIQSLIDKLNNGKKGQPLLNGNFMNCNLNNDFPMLFNQEKSRKNARKDGPMNGLKGEKKMRYNRNFNCNQCKANFNSLADLNRHTVETHSTFKCTICSASFTQRSNLQRHSLKHVGFKPFTCALCKKEYYRKDHLMRHIEVTHPHVDPKSSIITHLTSSECLEYLEKMNLSHNITNGNINIEKKTNENNTNALNDITQSKIPATLNGINDQNKSDCVLKNDIKKSNDSNNNHESSLSDMPSIDFKAISHNNDEKKKPEERDQSATNELEEDDSENRELSQNENFERDDCSQIYIHSNEESHLMQQTLDRSFKEAEIHRPEESITFINESIYDSGEVYKESSDNDELEEDENFEVDHGESEAAVAILQMTDESQQGPGLMEIDEQSQLNVK